MYRVIKAFSSKKFVIPYLLGVSLLTPFPRVVLSATDFSIEMDPLPYILKGYSTHVRYHSPGSYWSFGIGTFAMEVPDVLTKLDKANADKPWRATIAPSVAFGIDRYLFEKNSGWFSGAMLLWMPYQVSLDNGMNNKADFSLLNVGARFGYLYAPLAYPFYFTPWFGLGATIKQFGSRHIGNDTYSMAAVTPLMAIHAGYRF